MTKSYMIGTVVFSGMLMMATALSAKPWIVDPTQSHLTFVGYQGSKSFQGGFSRFQTTVDFDLAHPEIGKISATIDTSSATAGTKERDDYLPQSDWFNTAKFPEAHFVSSSIHAVGTDKTGMECYEAPGSLTIKSIAKQVVLPFCLFKEADHYRAKGTLPLMRSDFHVGEGEWGSEDVVKFAVDVTVDIAVKPAS